MPERDFCLLGEREEEKRGEERREEKRRRITDETPRHAVSMSPEQEEKWIDRIEQGQETSNSFTQKVWRIQGRIEDK